MNLPGGFQIRIGVEGSRYAILSKARKLNAPLLVSANSLWNPHRRYFGSVEAYKGFDIALDSGGFVAMKHYGRFRYTARDYVGLAKALNPTWWAQMDFCCEPEIVHQETGCSSIGPIRQRILNSLAYLDLCSEEAVRQNIKPPLPVLQGWKPTDYEFCATLYDDHIYGGRWPSLVGIGSVCRRDLYGPDGLFRIVQRLHEILPSGVRFHLFGVKGRAVERLLTYFPTRAGSVDSMAWNMAARWTAVHQGIRCDSKLRAESMETWYEKQFSAADQKQLSLAF